ncbi:hypothetical protein BV898_19769 [Hypsibius exemplaris]|uniref:Uncharacterized protein n=1 Tax=Hypsibius exemplaris TaxID=2072580 RepID=A0A9X6RPY7_HYPEX|nr:hypothetical protein BV898_19769 [Hypsibius exemplaris]
MRFTPHTTNPDGTLLSHHPNHGSCRKQRRSNPTAPTQKIMYTNIKRYYTLSENSASHANSQLTTTRGRNRAPTLRRNLRQVPDHQPPRRK